MSSFIERKKGPVRTLNTLKNSDLPVNDLVFAMHLSERIGYAISPLVRRFGLSLDFRNPSRCRLEGSVITLLVDNAAQHSKLRQLTTRLLSLINEKGIAASELKIKVKPYRLPPPSPVTQVQGEPRGPSEAGVKALDNILSSIKNPALKETLTSLKKALDKKENTDRQAQDAQISALIEQKEALQRTLNQTLDPSQRNRLNEEIVALSQVINSKR